MLKWLKNISLLVLPGTSMQVLAKTEQTVTAVAPSSAGSILNVIFGLIIVLLVIYGMFLIIKKMGGIPGRANNLINVVSGINLSHRDKIILVQVGDEQLLLGLSPGRINLLHTLNQPLQEKKDTHPQESSFASKLAGVLRGDVKE